MVTYADMLTLKPLGDPPADRVAAELLDTGQVGDVEALLRTVSSIGHDVPGNTPPLLRNHLEETRGFPEWTDPDRVAHISAFYRKHRRPADTVLCTTGLVGTYLSPVGARTLHSAHRPDRPHRQLAQSTGLFLAMGEPDAFTRRSGLIPACQKVRLVHAAIRLLHTRSGRWDSERDGMPVSLLQTYGAALVCSIATLDGLQQLGVQVSPVEEDGYYYAWRLIGHWLGLPDRPVPLPDGVGEARTLWHEARDGGEWAPSEEGVLLTRSCTELYESYLPPGLKGIVPALLRQTLTDRFADMAGLPHAVHRRGTPPAESVEERLHHHSSTGSGHRRLHHYRDHQLLEALGHVARKVGRGPERSHEGSEPQLADHC